LIKKVLVPLAPGSEEIEIGDRHRYSPACRSKRVFWQPDIGPEMQLDSYIAQTPVNDLEMREPVTPIIHLAYLILLNRLVFFGNRFRVTFGWFQPFGVLRLEP
jgi:hypothetical protein